MAIYNISNSVLSVSISDIGGELLSIKMGEHEFLWGRDEKYWSSSSPLLFPAVGRLRDGVWMDGEDEYTMPVHGFARSMKMRAVAMRDFAEFTLTDNKETKKMYPYSFALRRRFKLAKNAILESITVSNTDRRNIYFGLGLHPGFMLPEGNARLSLGCRGDTRRMLLSPRFIMSGESEPYALEDGKYITLQNSLFDNDAIILNNVISATIESDASSKKIKLICPDAHYFGFWQPMHAPDTPFVCIEPWQSLPAREKPDATEPDQISERDGFVCLAPGESYTYNCRMEFEL